MVKKTKSLSLNFGPQHPAAHGVLRLILQLDGEIEDFLAMLAGTDDPVTPETDGFTAGNEISFRMWDTSEGVEIDYVVPIYTDGGANFPTDGLFVTQGSAMLDLDGTSIILGCTDNVACNYVEEANSELDLIAKIAYQDTPDAHPGLAVDQTLSHLLSHEKDGKVMRVDGGWVRT